MTTSLKQSKKIMKNSLRNYKRNRKNCMYYYYDYEITEDVCQRKPNAYPILCSKICKNFSLDLKAKL
jgi:hypothetical protein